MHTSEDLPALPRLRRGLRLVHAWGAMCRVQRGWAVLTCLLWLGASHLVWQRDKSRIAVQYTGVGLV